MSNPAGKPKPAFFAILAIVVLGLVGYAYYRYSNKGKADTGKTDTVDLSKIKEQAGTPVQAENPDNLDGVTTAKEYQFESGTKLPEVPGSSDYKPLQDR